jgi:hypothetical protein
LTGGAQGIVVRRASLFGVNLRDDRAFYYVIFICFVVMAWIAVNLVRTRYGRAFIAIRDNDRAAEGMGIPIFRFKLLSFAVSSFYAGFAGALFAYYMMSITPEPFNLCHDHHRGSGEDPWLGFRGHLYRRTQRGSQQSHGISYEPGCFYRRGHHHRSPARVYFRAGHRSVHHI